MNNPEPSQREQYNLLCFGAFDIVTVEIDATKLQGRPSP